MALLPLPSSSFWPSLRTSSDPLFGDRLEALGRANAYHPLHIVPLKSGDLAVVSGMGSQAYEFTCSPAELGAILQTGLHMALDITRAIRYTTPTEESLGIEIEL